MATYELKRSEVRDGIVAVLKQLQVLTEGLGWDESQLYDVASDICDEIGIEDDE